MLHYQKLEKRLFLIIGERVQLESSPLADTLRKVLTQDESGFTGLDQGSEITTLQGLFDEVEVGGEGFVNRNEEDEQGNEDDGKDEEESGDDGKDDEVIEDDEDDEEWREEEEEIQCDTSPDLNLLRNGLATSG